MNPSRHYDLAVLGGGSAGYAAARTAVAEGLKTVVIDGAKELGGLCILRGCMPSKTLIESANRNLVIKDAANFGLKAIPGPADIHTIRERKRRLIQDFANYRQGQLQDGRFDLVRGHAKFTESTIEDVQLSVDLLEGGTEQITAGHVIIATGSVIEPPPIPGLKETGYWTSDTVLDAEELPDSFIVLGGGAIALELAHYLNAIDREVTVIQRSAHLLSGMDSDLGEVVEKAFKERNITIHTNTKITGIEKAADGGKKVTFLQDGKTTITIEANEILFALGRRPATSKLNLEAAEIEALESGHIPVSPNQQTTNPRIFAAGDICGPLEVVHLAITQGETAAKNIARKTRDESVSLTMDYRCKMLGIFTEPQVATVGISENEAKNSQTPYITASYPFGDHGKSMVMEELHGFVKVIADPKTGKLLGASVVGPEATELIHQMAIALHLGATAASIVTAPFYHPTLSEIWSYPLEEISENIC